MSPGDSPERTGLPGLPSLPRVPSPRSEPVKPVKGLECLGSFSLSFLVTEMFRRAEYHSESFRGIIKHDIVSLARPPLQQLGFFF